MRATRLQTSRDRQTVSWAKKRYQKSGACAIISIAKPLNRSPGNYYAL